MLHHDDTERYKLLSRARHVALENMPIVWRQNYDWDYDDTRKQ